MEKVLIIHCKYRNLGGEDIAVENEVKLLEKHFNVKKVFFSNRDLHLFNILFSLLFNRNMASLKKLKKEVELFKPNFVYVHNTWFAIPLSLFKYLKNNNIKTLIKLHNFRYKCTRSFLIKNHTKDNNFCPLCGANKRKFTVFNKYFKESYFKSFFVIKYGKKYFKILNNKYFKLLVLTNFHKKYLVNLGINEENIYVFRNYLDINSNFEHKTVSDKYIVYAGRISYEKGVDQLIKSFNNVNLNNFHLKIIGNGPDFDYLKKIYSSNSIKFYGHLSNDEVKKIISKSKAVITVTTLYEGQPTLLCEASLLGVPSIFPETGGISEFFPKDYKLSFQQFNYEELENKIKLLEDENFIQKIGLSNQKFISQLTSENILISKFKTILHE